MPNKNDSTPSTSEQNQFGFSPESWRKVQSEYPHGISREIRDILRANHGFFGNLSDHEPLRCMHVGMSAYIKHVLLPTNLRSLHTDVYNYVVDGIETFPGDNSFNGVRVKELWELLNNLYLAPFCKVTGRHHVELFASNVSSKTIIPFVRWLIECDPATDKHVAVSFVTPDGTSGGIVISRDEHKVFTLEALAQLAAQRARDVGL